MNYFTKDTGLDFFITRNGINVNFSEWAETVPEEIAQISIINELVENGFADNLGDCCHVDWANIYFLSEIDCQILELPDFYPYHIYIQSVGTLNQESFKFKIDFYDFIPNGNRFAAVRNGSFLTFDDRTYLLSKKQFDVCEKIAFFNNLPLSEKMFDKNLIKFSELKALSEETAFTLDSYLNNENVHCPEKIKIEIEYKNEALEVKADVGANKEKFREFFDRSSEIKSVYPTVDEFGKRTRVVLSEQQQEELKKIKKHYRKITSKDQIDAFIKNPEVFLDPDIIDVSVFYSSRVIEIGIYKPRFYPFITPYKSQWLPCIGVEDRVNGSSKVLIKNIEEVELIKNKIANAEERFEAFIDHKGLEIPIKDAKVLVEVATKQLKTPKEPLKETIENGEKKDVLIIEENADLLGYNEFDPKFSIDMVHKFYELNNLSEEISLIEHQKEGIAWLQSLYDKKSSGALLADDMGLGKTLQILYFIEWHAQKYKNNKPYIIVAPVSLLENWENEYLKFFKKRSLEITKLYGNIEISRQFNKNDVKILQSKELILTNYETLRNYQLNICAVNFSIAVLDEAQKIKTPGTFITNVTKAIKSDFKIAMTGTPVENGLVDLWCIMDFAVPGLLGNAKEFSKEYQSPLKKEDTDISALCENLRKKVGIFIKRRLKIDVAKDLPAKSFEIDEKIMPKEQEERYMTAIMESQNIADCGRERGAQILRYLHEIQVISDHPYIADKRINEYSPEEIVRTSAKLQSTMEILEKIRNKNEKVIIFTEKREVQRMLQTVIKHFFRITPKIINGDTPSSSLSAGKSKLSRQQTIDEFKSKEGFNVVIMSQIAAGVGLNVTAANHVIHFSRHWNPAKEEQATDRVYRIGQNKEVFVYYPMAILPQIKTFDIVLNELLQKKHKLSESSLFPTEQVEVYPEDLFNNVFQGKVTIDVSPLSFEEISKLKPFKFEAFTAALFEKMGYKVDLTPNSNDKGADVVAFGNEKNILIQCKQSTYNVDMKAVQEILGAKGYYNLKHNIDFELVIFTNNCLNDNAKNYAICNNVRFYEGADIEKLIRKFNVKITDVDKAENKRLTRV